MADLLELRGVSASYGRIQAIAGVDLAVPEGAIVALLGANGAGKTTTLNTISRLVPTTAGSILFEGKPIERGEFARRGARRHLAGAGGARGVPRDERRRKSRHGSVFAQ